MKVFRTVPGTETLDKEMSTADGKRFFLVLCDLGENNFWPAAEATK